MAALMVLTITLAAPNAEAKKKNRLQFNPVQCPNQEDGETCNGTAGNDHLVWAPTNTTTYSAEKASTSTTAKRAATTGPTRAPRAPTTT